MPTKGKEREVVVNLLKHLTKHRRKMTEGKADDIEADMLGNAILEELPRPLTSNARPASFAPESMTAPVFCDHTIPPFPIMQPPDTSCFPSSTTFSRNVKAESSSAGPGSLAYLGICGHRNYPEGQVSGGSVTCIYSK